MRHLAVKVTQWYDGSTMGNAKADGKKYISSLRNPAPMMVLITPLSILSMVTE